jgi:L,D-transpeptidase YcbB
LPFPLRAMGRGSLSVLLLASLLADPGTPRRSAVRSAVAAGASADEIREIVTAGRLSDLAWPDFSDYQAYVKSFYEPSAYALAWVHQNEATPQARAMIEVLRQADSKGLRAEDYDARLWDSRILELGQPAKEARFDVDLTVCAMRFISDLRVGRVNPRHFKFGIDVQRKRYDLAQFVRDRLVNGADIRATVEEVEPPFPGYRRTQAALARYLKLMGEDDGEKLPEVPKAIDPGTQYAGVPRLARLLHSLGDLAPSADVPPGNVYQGPLVDAVKSFQRRHGLLTDGRLGPQTVKLLNTPLSSRVEQLRLTLERWRWAPEEFPQPPVIVNIPEFRLRAYNPDGAVALRSNVIVGKSYRHETPVFEEQLEYVVFRPYWNVPPAIQLSEIVPAVGRDRDYIAKNNYEVVTYSGQVVTSGRVSDDVLEQLRSRKLAVRQKPGPANALGLVKLIFPNEHNVYLHSTPAQRLFAESKRDFSHGCIRVEKADELAAWALAGNQQEWTLEKVRAAMQGQSDNVQVNLSKPIPVLILYATAVVDPGGVIYFFEDLYGHDRELEKVLAKGYPYPR